MSRNYLSIDIGGKKRGLKFDMGAKEVALQQADSMDATSHIVPVAIMAYAGLVANCEIKGEEPDFTLPDVKKWIRRIDQEQYNEILLAWNTAFNIKLPDSLVPTSGEGGKDTQALNVA